MRLGAHVSTAGGISKAIGRAQDIGAETIQIFASSPRAWAFNFPSEKEVLLFREQSERSDVVPSFIHGSYLVNVGGAPEVVQKSIQCLIRNMETAHQIGALGVIFHGGSHKGLGFNAVLDQAVHALTTVMERSPSKVWLIIENSAGMGAHIGASFQELGVLVRKLDHPRIKVCLDTQHSFAAGYNLADPDTIKTVMGEFDSEIGLNRLVAVHANDSKIDCGSGIDRHENIGEGHIGQSGFESIMNHQAFREIPFLLEVPGFDKKGPDKQNMMRIKAIRDHLSIPK